MRSSFLVLCSIFTLSTGLQAQEVAFEVVSDYVWRGQSQGEGAAIQPSLNFDVPSTPVSLGVWGSRPVSGGGTTEIDISASVTLADFIDLSVVSYYFGGEFLNSDFQDIEIEIGTGFDDIGDLSIAYTIHGVEDDPFWVEFESNELFDTGLNLTLGFGSETYSESGDDFVTVVGLGAQVNSVGTSLIYNADSKTAFAVGVLSF